jgi:redox-sensitive bicupin YhaK (pirin superfamily)
MERPVAPYTLKPVLNQDGCIGELIQLEPAAELALVGAAVADRLLFVVTGNVTIDTDGLTTLVGEHAAHLLPAGRPATLTAGQNGPASVLQVHLPVRRAPEPVLITPGELIR